MAPSRIADKFIIRLPDGMRERIKAEAMKSHRSMNSEIVFQLERAFGSSSQDIGGTNRLVTGGPADEFHTVVCATE